MKRRVQPHPEHLTPADRRSWKRSAEALAGDIDEDTAKALKNPCASCGANPGTACTSADGTPHAVRLG